MKSTVENLGPTRVRLAVEVPFDELGPSLDKAYKSIARQVKVPGFRPGKAPARIIDQRVGRAAVLDEAVQDAIPRYYAAAIRDNSVRTVGQPEIELTHLNDGDRLAFTAEVDVRPEVRVPDLTALSATVDDAVVAAEEIQEQLTSLRERFAVLRAADRPAATDDYVSIDMAATADGQEVPDGSTTGLSYQVGGGSLLPGLDDALVGMSAGEQRTFSTELVAGPFAGRTADVTVTVRSVKEKELPELDDEFAQTASEFDTLAELEADLRSRLERVRALEQGSQARDRVVEAVLAATDVPLPASAVQTELDWRTQDVRHRLEHAGATLDQYLTAERQSRDEFDAELRRSSEAAVMTQLVLDAIADQQQLAVSDADLSEHLVMQARRYGVGPEELANRMAQSGSLPSLVADVRRSKALAYLLEVVPVTDASGRRVDLAALRRASDPDAVGEADRPDADQPPAAGPGGPSGGDEPGAGSGPAEPGAPAGGVGVAEDPGAAVATGAGAEG